MSRFSPPGYHWQDKKSGGIRPASGKLPACCCFMSLCFSPLFSTGGFKKKAGFVCKIYRLTAKQHLYAINYIPVLIILNVATYLCLVLSLSRFLLFSLPAAYSVLEPQQMRDFPTIDHYFMGFFPCRRLH